MKTRYPKCRLVATLLGLWAAWILVETVAAYLRGPPPGCFVRSYGGFCWVAPSPEVQFCLVVTWEILAVGGTSLMWFRPRLGYLCAGLGYQLYLTLTFVNWIAAPDVSRDLDSAGWVLRSWALPIWLFWLCVKDEPTHQRQGGSCFLLPPERARCEEG